MSRITVAKAKEMLDDLDDFARMECSVDPIGPVLGLADFIEQYEALAARVERMRDAIKSLLSPYMSGIRVTGADISAAEALIATPDDTAKAILAERDARTLRKAADELYAIADGDGPEHSWGPRACAYSSAGDLFSTKANELSPLKS